ncbi:hypothetical protein Ahy_A06g026203 isoform A [Arachis hypogaea]|uniref:CTCHY-type domain-containing protein n=1 Tax=Arachis hypogaea TaxID=3818 RepID=A0A445CJN9_ARAHY|nr:hypothetical protein Ahy_A06g026203 isoform A [Arachis hypogaea]
MEREQDLIITVVLAIALPHRHCYSHSSANGEESDEKQSFSSKNKFSSRNASSKYDFVKVKVRLGDNADHYYVLSRFLLSRCGWMIMLQCGFDLENGQCWFIWNSFVRNWKFEPSPNINNQLSGPIAAEIGKLSELQTLELSSNQFVGGIPSSLGLLSQLSYLWLSKNNLSGQIPPLVTNLTGLSFLHVLYSSMKFCNTFTSSISQVQDLSFNNLSGPTPKILAKGNNFLCTSPSEHCMDISKPLNGVKKFSLNIKKTGKGVLPKNEKDKIETGGPTAMMRFGWQNFLSFWPFQNFYQFNVVCAICNTEQPIGKQQIHCDECEICRVGGQENYFHCEKCGSCYLVTLRDNHLCGELHGHVHY